MLHTVNKSPFTSNALDECARFATEGSPILLIEDGVFAAMAGTSYEAKLKELMKSHEIYALGEDMSARGLTKAAPGVKITDYYGFVELVERFKPHAWL